MIHEMEMLLPEESTLEIFTDGSFDAGSRTGGWAFVVLEHGRQVHAAGGTAVGGSNNSFEVLAVLKAMAWINAECRGRSITLWTDSLHVTEGCHRWRAIWRNNGWRRIDPNPRARRRKLADAVLWRELDGLLDLNPDVTIAWCKGHSGIAGNDHADELAGRGGSPPR